MTNDRLWELVEAESKSWDETIEALGGRGNVPIRYLLNMPETTSQTECQKNDTKAAEQGRADDNTLQTAVLCRPAQVDIRRACDMVRCARCHYMS